MDNRDDYEEYGCRNHAGLAKSESCAGMHKDIKDRKVIINSVTLVDRQEYIDIALEYNAGIVALPIDSRMPDTLEKSMKT